MMFLAVALTAQPAPAPTEPTAGETFKNIKILKDMPASQLMPVMHLMR